jgi:hypothetical protein
MTARVPTATKALAAPTAAATLLITLAVKVVDRAAIDLLSANDLVLMDIMPCHFQFTISNWPAEASNLENVSGAGPAWESLSGMQLYFAGIAGSISSLKTCVSYHKVQIFIL